MIVLLNCSINLLANNTDSHANNPSTGELVGSKDSVAISYDDLRIVNGKLIELKYQKQINANLRTIINNDSIIIKDYKTINDNLKVKNDKLIKQRNLAIGGTLLFLISTIVLIIK